MEADKLTKILETVFGSDIESQVEIDTDSQIIELRVADAKVPFIIGKQGRNIKSIRELIYLYNKLHSTNYRLELIEDRAPVDADSDMADIASAVSAEDSL